MSLGTIILNIGNAISVIIPPIFLFPSKIKKWMFPIVFLGVLGLYVLAEFFNQLQSGDVISYPLYFICVLTIEVLLLIGVIFICTKGNFWKYWLLEVIYMHLANAVFMMIVPLFPKVQEAIENDLLCVPIDLLAGAETTLLLATVCAILALLFHFFIPINNNFPEKPFKYIAIVYHVISLGFAIVKQSYFYDFIYNSSRTSTINMIIVGIIIAVGVIVGCNLVGYLYNRMEIYRIRREQAHFEKMLLYDDIQTEGISSCNIVMDKQIQELILLFREEDIAFELTMNQPYKSDKPLSEYEIVILLQSLESLIRHRKNKRAAWAVIHLHWNSDMMMLDLEFSRNHDFRRLQNQREFENIYDILNRHEGLMRICRRVNTYEIEMLLF